MIKIFGLGNILLCDDGIGVRVLESLREKLNQLGKDIELIIGETVYKYCIEQVKDDDFIIIIDSTNLMIKPGKVSKITFEECDKFLFIDNQSYIDNNDEIFLKKLRTEKKYVKGYLLGIEVDEVKHSAQLSKKIKFMYNKICDNIYEDIASVINERNTIRGY